VLTVRSGQAISAARDAPVQEVLDPAEAAASVAVVVGSEAAAGAAASAVAADDDVPRLTDPQ